jgi:hypothetical protein
MLGHRMSSGADWWDFFQGAPKKKKRSLNKNYKGPMPLPKQKKSKFQLM